MQSSPRIIINGKFLSVPLTGVHRVAQELANALAELAAERNLPGFEMWLPHDGAQRAASIRLPTHVKRPLRSIPWEQITLPLAAGNKLILSLCNIGPVISRNAITMIHDAQVHTSPESYRRGFRLWYKLVQPFIVRRHLHVLTVSEFSRRQLIAVGLASPGKISVVHNGVDHILAVPPEHQIIERLSLIERRYVVALASAQAHKNIGLLLEAFADRDLAEIKLVLVGDADASAFSPSPNIVLPGRVSDGELRALYEGAICVAFPSRTEGFGLPPMEAMRVGCPAIVAPCGALPEVCGDAAVYADPASPQAWRDAILQLAGDPERWHRISEAGKIHAAQFTWRRAAEQVIAILASEPVSHVPRRSQVSHAAN